MDRTDRGIGQGNVAQNIFEGEIPAAAAAEPHSAPSAGMVLGPVHPDNVVPVTAD